MTVKGRGSAIAQPGAISIVLDPSVWVLVMVAMIVNSQARSQLPVGCVRRFMTALFVSLALVWEDVPVTVTVGIWFGAVCLHHEKGFRR
jgi:hypothetical protein